MVSVVRVVQTRKPKDGTRWEDRDFECTNEGGQISDSFLEALQQAGLVVIKSPGSEPGGEWDQITDQANGNPFKAFDILPPDVEDEHQWAEDTARYMTALGFNAIATTTEIVTA